MGNGLYFIFIGKIEGSHVGKARFQVGYFIFDAGETFPVEIEEHLVGSLIDGWAAEYLVNEGVGNRASNSFRESEYPVLDENKVPDSENREGRHVG